MSVVILPRFVFVGTTLGVGPAVTQGVVAIVALLLDVGRLRTPQA